MYWGVKEKEYIDEEVEWKETSKSEAEGSNHSKENHDTTKKWIPHVRIVNQRHQELDWLQVVGIKIEEREIEEPGDKRNMTHHGDSDT